jgi:hypothetical protein
LAKARKVGGFRIRVKKLGKDGFGVLNGMPSFKVEDELKTLE